MGRGTPGTTGAGRWTGRQWQRGSRGLEVQSLRVKTDRLYKEGYIEHPLGARKWTCPRQCCVKVRQRRVHKCCATGTPVLSTGSSSPRAVKLLSSAAARTLILAAGERQETLKESTPACSAYRHLHHDVTFMQASCLSRLLGLHECNILHKMSFHLPKRQSCSPPRECPHAIVWE